MRKSKAVSIMATSAALYAVFFFLSKLVALPTFTILYMPIILLAVFPIWFGWSGLIGSMIGAIIGGAFVEGLGLLAWIEAVTTLIIYGLNWLLTPQRASEAKTKRDLLLLLTVYAMTLLAGTGYILWQFAFFGLFSLNEALIILMPTFAVNFVIEAIIGPILLRALSSRMKNWGLFTGTLSAWRNRH